MASTDEPTTVNNLLKRDIVLEAPVYQRRFAWIEKQLNDFWEDFDEVRDDKDEALFLGAIILKHEESSTSSLAERWLIIDGQQRLTALSLAIAALCLEAQSISASDPPGVAAFVNDQVRRYLLPQSSGNLKRLDTKVMVTTPDLDDYRSALGLIGTPELLPLSGQINENSKIHQALELHREAVRSRIPEDPVLSDFETLLEELVSKTELVEIHLADRHDPNQVFNRLNYKGQPLTLGDLVRNEAFSRFSHDREGANKAHRSYWKQFEERFVSDKSREDYYWPFTLARVPQATKGKAFSILRERWQALGDEESADDAETAIKLIVEDLGQFVDAFNLIHEGKGFEGLGPNVTKAALRLKRMKLPSVTYCFLLQVLDASSKGQLTASDAQKTLETVESFLVRRAMIGLEPTGLHAVFKRLWTESKGQPSKVRSGLVTATIEFPSDNEVRQKLPKVNMYKKRLAKYIMAEYERSIMSGDPLSEEQLTNFTIDHAAPQSLLNQWAKKHRTSKDRLTELLNSWGNLVPLSAEANSSKGASDWAQAKRKLANETIYSTTKRLLAENEAWTPDTIQSRTRILTEWALKRWPDQAEA